MIKKDEQLVSSWGVYDSSQASEFALLGQFSYSKSKYQDESLCFLY